MKWERIETGHYRSENGHFVLRTLEYGTSHYGVYGNPDNPPNPINFPTARDYGDSVLVGNYSIVSAKTIKETQEKFDEWLRKHYVEYEALKVEAYPISLEDLDNTLMGIIDVRTTFDVIGVKDELSVLNSDFYAMFELFVETYDWRNKKFYRWLPKLLCFKTIITTEGRYVFAIRQATGGFYTGHGLWIVEESDKTPLVVGTARLAFFKEDGEIKKRSQPMLVVINDATNLCALEFGTKTQIDDDPNQKYPMTAHTEWNPDPGFVTNYFQEEPDIEPTVIPGKDSRVVGDGYTPKKLQRNRGKGRDKDGC